MAHWFPSERPSNWEYASLFIEAPSTLMEHMIAHHLKETAENEAARTRVKMLQLLTFHHNFITHQSEAEILRRLYQAADRGEALSTAAFKRTSRAVLQEFWEDTVELDEGADLYWRQFHYYSGLYAYTYAVGLVASTVLSQRILGGEAGLVEGWLRLLKEGSSKPPLEALRMVDLDRSSPEPYRLAIAYVGQLVSDLEAAITGTDMR